MSNRTLRNKQKVVYQLVRQGTLCDWNTAIACYYDILYFACVFSFCKALTLSACFGLGWCLGDWVRRGGVSTGIIQSTGPNPESSYQFPSTVHIFLLSKCTKENWVLRFYTWWLRFRMVSKR